MRTRRRPGKRPDGYYHARITVALTPLAFGLGWLLLGMPAGLVAGLGCLAGIVLSPDLDQIGPTFSELVWRKIPLVGWLLAWVWLTIWLPYGIFSRHRGMSHTPVLGTLGRVIYLALFVVPLWLWAGWSAPSMEHFLPALFGLILSDIGHYGRDRWRWEV